MLHLCTSVSAGSTEQLKRKDLFHWTPITGRCGRLTRAKEVSVYACTSQHRKAGFVNGRTVRATHEASYLAFTHTHTHSILQSVSPTVVCCLSVNRCVMILQGSDRCLIFGGPVKRCDVFVLILRYGNRSLLSQNVSQGSERKPQ